jgi:hypothetical protein
VANADMSDALMGEEMSGELMDLGAEEPMGMFDEGDGLELGAGAVEDLDEAFAAEAQALFPDFDDSQLANLQRLIDARIDAKYGPEMGGDIGEAL